MPLQGKVATTSYKKLFRYQKQSIPQKSAADLEDAIEATEHPYSKGPIPKASGTDTGCKSQSESSSPCGEEHC